MTEVGLNAFESFFQFSLRFLMIIVLLSSLQNFYEFTFRFVFLTANWSFASPACRLSSDAKVTIVKRYKTELIW